MANIYDVANPGALLAPNTYPGRGIVIGKSEDGKKADMNSDGKITAGDARTVLRIAAKLQ